MNDLPKVYLFDNFRFDADRFALYHRDALVKSGDKKTMQVLAILLLSPNRLTAHDEIIEKVWRDNPHGVTSAHIGQYISKLRKIFAEYNPEKTYIETVKGRGYIFVSEISSPEIVVSANIQPASSAHLQSSLPESENETVEETVSSFRFSKRAIIFLALALASSAIFFLSTRFSADGEQEEIRRVVEESQFYESLVIYKNPLSFNESSLDKYWSGELDLNTNYDRRRIVEAVKKLNDEGRRYGDETKCEQFEFQSVEVNQNENLAVVKTLEKWFIAVYFSDGTLQKNKTVGPYFVSYIVKKIDGRWLIEKSTTARMSRPTPRLSDIEATSEMKSGQQFFVKITGQDFEAETVHIEIFGAGCPESKPCRISNAALRENSKITETALENIPLILASGDFRIIVRNGDSQASNLGYIKVP